MKKAIIIHGWPDKDEFFDPAVPSPSNNQWLPWLQKQLGMKGWDAQTPEMPDAYEPNYEKWKSVFGQFDLDEETTLVGHSCSGGFLARFLSENDVKVGNVFLIAPWIDPTKELGEGNDFFKFTLDENLAAKTASLTIFYSTDDDDVIVESVNRLKTIEGIKIREFSDKGHFCISDGVSEFPELLIAIIE
jgi:predicted alpha/beta hydrolase family esterase